MSPDLNSLPRRRSSMTSPLSDRPRRISINANDARASPPSPRSPSLSSLAAAATINAGLHRSPSRASPSLERRRSSLLNTISHNDPAIPAPGEMQHSNSGSPRAGRRSFSLNTADPQWYTRAPSLGELHQELENEQEAQVNRLLHQIRAQQHELAAIRRQHSDASPTYSDVNGLPTPPTPASTEHISSSIPAVGGYPSYHPRQHSVSRDSSARISFAGSSSRGVSPALRPQSGSLGPLTEDLFLSGTRDECSFYQAETSNLTRENQMLKHRIAELERQIAEMGGSGSAHSPLAAPPTSANGEAALGNAKAE